MLLEWRITDSVQKIMIDEFRAEYEALYGFVRCNLFAQL